MRATLIDLARHCIWADDELWRATEAFAPALADERLIARFRHIHLVQYAFLSIIRGEKVDAERGSAFSPAELREWGRGTTATLLELARLIPDDELVEHFEVPWFREPPIEISRGEAFLQVCLHTAHHRGQNATRLRELGGDPPLIDYIFWIWKGRPDPE